MSLAGPIRFKMPTECEWDYCSCPSCGMDQRVLDEEGRVAFIAAHSGDCEYIGWVIVAIKGEQR